MGHETQSLAAPAGCEGGPRQGGQPGRPEAPWGALERPKGESHLQQERNRGKDSARRQRRVLGAGAEKHRPRIPGCFGNGDKDGVEGGLLGNTERDAVSCSPCTRRHRNTHVMWLRTRKTFPGFPRLSSLEKEEKIPEN